MTMSANLRAFLALIRWAETGTSGPESYRVVVGGRRIDSLEDHPRLTVDVKFPNGMRVTSTAAGAYQFLAGTWDRCKAALGLPDFSPASQDEAAIWLIKQRGALEDVEAGRLREALEKCSWEWASLPPSRYGQPGKTHAQCADVFVRAGGIISTQGGGAAIPSTSNADAATDEPPAPPAPDHAAEVFGGEVSPARAPSSPPPSPRPAGRRAGPPQWPFDPHAKGAPMPVPAIVTAAASALLPVVADLMRLRGSNTSERNAQIIEKVGPVLVDAAKQVVQDAPNEQAAVERILADPELQKKLRAALAMRIEEIAPAVEMLIRLDQAEQEAMREAAGRIERMAAMPVQRMLPFYTVAALQFILTLLVMVGLGSLLWPVVQSVAAGREVGELPSWAALIIGSLLIVIALEWRSILQFVVGTTQGSAAKNAIIERLSDR